MKESPTYPEKISVFSLTVSSSAKAFKSKETGNYANRRFLVHLTI